MVTMFYVSSQKNAFKDYIFLDIYIQKPTFGSHYSIKNEYFGSKQLLCESLCINAHFLSEHEKHRKNSFGDL